MAFLNASDNLQTMLQFWDKAGNDKNMGTCFVNWPKLMMFQGENQAFGDPLHSFRISIASVSCSRTWTSKKRKLSDKSSLGASKSDSYITEKSRRSTPIPKLNSDLLPFWTLASLSMCCNNQSTTLNIWPPENGLIYAYACFFLNVVCEFFFVSSFNAKPCAGSLLSAASCSCFSWVRGPMDATWCNYLPSAEVSWLRGLSALPKSHVLFCQPNRVGYGLHFI